MEINMAGVKGRSGSGGRRPGAGRKRKPETPPPDPVSIETCDMLEMLQRVALGKTEATPLQVRAAIAAVQYTHAKVGEAGKKSSKGDAAKAAGEGRFAPASGPRLAAVNGQRVVGGKAA